MALGFVFQLRWIFNGKGIGMLTRRAEILCFKAWVGLSSTLLYKQVHVIQCMAARRWLRWDYMGHVIWRSVFEDQDNFFFFLVLPFWAMSFTMGLIVDGTKIGAPNYLPPSKFGA